MMRSKLLGWLLPLLLLAAVAGQSRADDLDLLLGSGSVPPNVLIMLDSSGSMRNIMWDDDFNPKKLYPTVCDPGSTRVNSFCPGQGNPGDECPNNDPGTSFDQSLAPSTTYTCYPGGPMGAGVDRTIHIDPSHGITIYSDNYMNWLYGANPAVIDGLDESRITVAKQVLTDIVNQFNPDLPSGGYRETVRFGLGKLQPNNGGCVIAPIESGNKADLLTKLANVEPTGNTPLSEALADMGRYYAGDHNMGTYARYNTAPIGCGTTSSPPESPIDDECRKNFIILMTDGEPVSDTQGSYIGPFMNTIGNADNDANECSLLAPATCTDAADSGRDDGWTYKPGSGSDWLDDVAYYLYHTDLNPDLPGDQNIVTYTIGFTLDHPLLLDTAANGDGSYFTTTQADALKSHLETTLADVLNRSFSFTAVTVPAARTKFGDGFYNTFFHPSPTEAFWEGRLEAFRLTAAGGIEDRNGNPPTAPATGLFVDTRLPYWDAGVELRSNASRTLYTTIAGVRTDFSTANVLLDPATLGVDASQLPSYPNYPASGVNTVGKLRDALLDYVAGRDAFDQDHDTDSTELRDAVLGDIFHSTPVVVAQPPSYLIREEGFGVASSGTPFYKEYQNRDRVIYAGANDGMLHAFEAGQFHTGDNIATPGVVENGYYDMGTGAERFGYVPGMQLDRIRMVPRNVPRVYYYVDGTPTIADAWLGDPGDPDDITKSPEEWATVLVVGMRQGGEGYLALDVTDPDDTTGAGPHGPYPKLLWEFDSGDSPHLGDTWSEPVITRVKVQAPAGSGDRCGWDNGDGDCREEWVAIFGGGYTSQGNPNTGAYDATSLAGKGIFVVELDSGNLLASVTYDPLGADGPDTMTYALPSSPAVLDLDFDGLADLVYIGDLGGQLWKWDLSAVGVDSDSDGDIDNWDAGVLFEAPVEDMGGGVSHYKSLFYPPSVTYFNRKLYLGFATGEREELMYEGDPARDENNRIYALKDPVPTGPGAFAFTYSEVDLTDITGLDTDPDPTDMGFYLAGRDGEKFVTNHTIIGGYLITASFLPGEPGLCGSAAGGAILYVLHLNSGKGFFFNSGVTTGDAARRISIGSGVPTDPRIAISAEGGGRMYVKTSWGQVYQSPAPDPGYPPVEMIYWKQNF